MRSAALRGLLHGVPLVVAHVELCLLALVVAALAPALLLASDTPGGARAAGCALREGVARATRGVRLGW